MTAEDLSRETSGVVLPPEVSSEIWAETQEASAVMKFAQRIVLPGPGVVIPMITGDPAADWVNETDEIGVDDSTLDAKQIAGYKLGVIETFSNEFRRDLPALYSELKTRLPGALATKFDATVMHATVAPGANFDVLGGVDTLPLRAESAYDDLVAIEDAVATANGAVSGYVLAPKARGVLLSAVDQVGRPLLLNDIQREGGISHLMGVPVAVSRAAYKAGEDDEPNVLGLAGDFSQTFYGIVEAIEVSVSDQATVTKGMTTLNLWQRDMFALKATVHLGFAVRDDARLVRIVDAGEDDGLGD